LQKTIVLLLTFFLIPISNISDVSAQEDFDSSSIGLGMPDITITPTSGPPGTKIEISVTNMPAAPKGIDPRIEFFVYLPFVAEFGGNVPYNCGGESCFPLYSFEEVGAGKFAPKKISMTLFSTTNPKPIVEAGWTESVCDLKINGNTIERYGKACIDNDQPAGDYEIKFGWGIQRSDLYDIRKTLSFTVVEKESVTEQLKQDQDEMVIDQYGKGLISESEFEKRLKEFGYDDQEIRRAKALIGKLENQQKFQAPLKGPITIQGTDYELVYGISGGTVTQVTPDLEAQSLIIQMNSISNGTLLVKLPRDVIDSKFEGKDDDFFVLIDGLDSEFKEGKTETERTLTIPFPEGSEEIEIIGTSVVPEFGSIAVLVLIVSLISVVFISQSKLKLLTYI